MLRVWLAVSFDFKTADELFVPGLPGLWMPGQSWCRDCICLDPNRSTQASAPLESLGHTPNPCASIVPLKPTKRRVFASLVPQERAHFRTHKRLRRSHLAPNQASPHTCCHTWPGLPAIETLPFPQETWMGKSDVKACWCITRMWWIWGKT